ncbi:MAG: DUF1027 domain-containing protein [Streptococcaceae bacterium]|jgi:uncharacterized protein YutD|nr:DUF1027 domain-containing protein [Streptococcaceae bacterium]
MAKVIPEEEKNYNKFPGDHVIVLDDVVTIGDKVFHLVHDHQSAFDSEKLEQRYSDIFAKYDYIVGDWGHEQLRLKGFFSTSRKKMPDELKISRLEEYIKEYMNFGAAFFVLKRMRSKDIKREEAFLEEKVYEVKTPTVNKSKKAGNKIDEPHKRTDKRTQAPKAQVVQKEKSVKRHDPIVKTDTQNVSAQHTRNKRPTFVVRTRNK